MPTTAKRLAVYGDLFDLPDNVIGEIVQGELIATPRPSPRHTNAISVLQGEIGPPYRFGRGGPGGWRILVEPEIKLGEHILVPDLAGWKMERLPSLPEADNWISLAPDWVCEVLSPSTLQLDKTRKMPIYAAFEVPNLWLLDPASRTLEVFRLSGGRWLLLAAHAENEKVRAEPFQEVELDLALLWA